MSQPAIQRLPVEEALIAAFEEARAQLPGRWLADARAKAAQRFAAEGLPHRRMEAYRYFDLRRILARAGTLAPAAPWSEGIAFADPAAAACAGLDRYRMVFANGRYRPDLSDIAGLPAGVEAGTLAGFAESAPDWLRAALGDLCAPDGPADPVAALNLAFAGDGAMLRVPDGVSVDKPVEIVWFSAGGEAAHQHALSAVVLGRDAALTLLETRGDGATSALLGTQALHIRLGEGARLAHASTLADRPGSVRLARVEARLAARARYMALGMGLGRGQARTDMTVRLEGPQAHAGISGVTLIGGDAVMDNTLFVDHASPEGTSEETFRAVLDERARGVFQGSILVRPGAQKTDAQMQARALLLACGTEMDAKPMLEIYADDVQCAHGSAIGEPDRDALFYLMTRGLDETSARALLVAGFLEDVVDGFGVAGVVQAFKAVLARRLGAPEDDALEGDEPGGGAPEDREVTA